MPLQPGPDPWVARGQVGREVATGDVPGRPPEAVGHRLPASEPRRASGACEVRRDRQDPVVMDLVHSGTDDLAAALVTAHRDAGGDPGDDALLSFFAAYRAWVRAKVACLRAGEL